MKSSRSLSGITLAMAFAFLGCNGSSKVVMDSSVDHRSADGVNADSAGVAADVTTASGPETGGPDREVAPDVRVDGPTSLQDGAVDGVASAGDSGGITETGGSAGAGEVGRMDGGAGGAGGIDGGAGSGGASDAGAEVADGRADGHVVDAPAAEAGADPARHYGARVPPPVVYVRSGSRPR